MSYTKPILYAVFGLASLALCWGSGLFDIAMGIDAGPSLSANVALLLLGMLIITHGGDLFTDSAISIARATRIPPVIIGGTLVSLATTFPEFMVSFTAALRDVPDLAVGNALGSCCCNIGLIVGTCALLSAWKSRKEEGDGSIPINRVTILGPGLIMLTATVLLYAFAVFDDGGVVDETGNPMNAISRWQAGVLFAIFIGYLLYSLRIAYLSRHETVSHEEAEQAEEIRRHIGLEALLFLGGAGLVVIGSRLLISNGEAAALALGVDPLVIGFTVLAVGTSLPEYTISVLSVVKRHGSLGVGNIIGANILNIGWVVAACAMYSPLPVKPQTLFLDIPVALTLMTVLLAASYRGERVTWKLGLGLFAVYAVWLTLMATGLWRHLPFM